MLNSSIGNTRIEVVKDEKVIFNSYNDIKRYTALLSKLRTVFTNIKGSKEHYSFPMKSFKKICSLASVYEEESIRFTLYIDEEEKPKQIEQFEVKREELVIPDYSSSYKPIDSTIDTTRESLMLKDQINPGLIIMNKSNAIAIKIYHCIYPLFFIFALLRLIHLIMLASHYKEILFNKYEVIHILLIISLVSLGLYGIYQMKHWMIKHFKYLNFAIVLCVIFNLFCLYIPYNESICGEKEKEYVGNNKGYHYTYFVLVMILQCVAIVLNCYIKNEYMRLMGEKMQESKLVMK